MNRARLVPFAWICALASAGGCQPSHARPASPGPRVAGYALPFTVGDSARLLQGNEGPWGHTGAAAYAFDFAEAIGTPVTAARAGRVFATEARFKDGNRTPGQENFIVIRHADGTFGRYYHLTEGGVLVSIGEEIARGDTIGRSGNTGASAGPHLHFDVTRGCAEWGCQTIPIRFVNAGADSLAQGHTYRALATAAR